MKRTGPTGERVIGILQAHEAGATCAGLCRRHGMSEGTFHGPKAEYSGMAVSEGRHFCAIGPGDNGARLKALGDGDARLKRLLVEQMLDMAAMKDLLSRNGDARREARSGRASAGPSRAVGIAGVKQTVRGTVRSAAGACEIAGAERKMVRSQSLRAPDSLIVKARTRVSVSWAAPSQLWPDLRLHC